MTPMRVVIDKARFRELVAGRAIAIIPFSQDRTSRPIEIEIILSDIGWTEMLRAVLDGMPAKTPPVDPPQALEFLPRRAPRRRGPGK